MKNLSIMEKLDLAFAELSKNKFLCSYKITCLDELYLEMDRNEKNKYIYIFEDEFNDCLDEEGNFINNLEFTYDLNGKKGLLHINKILNVFKKYGLDSGINKNDWENSFFIYSIDRKGF
jgi:hypothetical protein